MTAQSDVHIKLYIREGQMQVSKWGNSLAVRLPKALVEEMGLEVGDDINLVKAKGKNVYVDKFDRAEFIKQTLERMKGRDWKAPKDYKFSRAEANER